MGVFQQSLVIQDQTHIGPLYPCSAPEHSTHYLKGWVSLSQAACWGRHLASVQGYVTSPCSLG